MFSNVLKRILPAAVLCISAPAYSATQTWDWNSSTNPLSDYGYGNTISMSVGGVGLELSAWSDTGGLSGDNDDTVRSATMRYYQSGQNLGAINRDEVAFGTTGSPDHSVDSYNYASGNLGDVDLIGLEFSEAVNLSHINIGWGTDGAGSGGNGIADMSFAAYNGGGSPSSLSSLLNGSTWSSVLAGGFGWSNSVANVSVSGGYQAIGSPDDLFSKFWLVSAYNPLFASLVNNGSENDGFKLAGLYTNTRMNNGSSVPVPGTILLMLAGLLPLFRQQKISSKVKAA